MRGKLYEMMHENFRVGGGGEVVGVVGWASGLELYISAVGNTTKK
jgi:hypothetical protein